MGHLRLQQPTETLEDMLPHQIAYVLVSNEI